MYGPPEYPRASSSPTIILLVSGMTAVLGFLIGFFAGLGSGEAGTAPAPRVTVTVEGPAATPGDVPSGDVPPGTAAPDPGTPPGTGAPDTGIPPGTGTPDTGMPGTGTPPANAPAATTGPVSGNVATLRTLVVGVDIQPGTYRTTGPVTASQACYWARMKGTAADVADVLDAGMPTGPATVTILATDKSFQTGGCAEWTKA